MNTSPKDFPLSELRMVRLVFEDCLEQKYMMHLSQVQDFIKASLALHHSPGINPEIYQLFIDDGKTTDEAKIFAKTKPIIEIHVHKFDRLEPQAHWWSSPTLQPDDPNGAHIINQLDSERVWCRADIFASEQAEQDLD